MIDIKLWMHLRILAILMITICVLPFFRKDYPIVYLGSVLMGLFLIITDLDYNIYLQFMKRKE